MPTPQKKPAQSTSKSTSQSTSQSATSPSASKFSGGAPKFVSQAAEKTASAARSSAESFAKMGADTVKELFANSTSEASKAHDKAFAVGRESAENLSRVVDAFSRTLSDAVSLFRQNADAAIEVCHVTADISKTISSELVSSANTNFVENVELCKDACSCRNLNDMMDIQNKWLSSNTENFFNQSARISEMCFQLISEAAEPISERMSEATERFTKSLAA